MGHPFKRTGVDFTGPFYVKCEQGLKAHLLIYPVQSSVLSTLISCAIWLWTHVSTAVSNSPLPKDCLQLRSSITVKPKAAARLLKSIIRELAANKFLWVHHIQWIFNIENGSWWEAFSKDWSRAWSTVWRSCCKCPSSWGQAGDAAAQSGGNAQLAASPNVLCMSTEDVPEPLTQSHLLCGYPVQSPLDRADDKDDEILFGWQYA